MKHFFAFLIIIFTAPFTIAQVGVGPNRQVLPGPNMQDETILVRHPANPNIMFGSANTRLNNFNDSRKGAYITTNRGATWYGTDEVPTIGDNGGDPGPVIDKNGVIILTALANSGAGLIATSSTDNGITWRPTVSITTRASDKNSSASDDVPSSSYYGRSYVVWTLTASVYKIGISHTNDGGISWSEVREINSTGGIFRKGGEISIGPNGEVYVTWVTGLPEDYIGFAKSTNGGINWTVTENIFDITGIMATFFNGWGIRVASFVKIGVDRSGGPRHGWIYLVTTQKNLAPAGTDADIIFHRSTDGGQTWSAGTRVNQDPMNTGCVQFYPALNVDEQGGINIVYYDNRNYPPVGDSAQVYMSRSTDGGNTWFDVLISDRSWKIKPSIPATNYMGDYIGITSGSGRAWPFWFDDRTGITQAWIAEVDLNPVNINFTHGQMPGKLLLGQNNPNPFNPFTKIKFQIRESSHTKLGVYDISGKEITVLVNSKLNPGEYESTWDGSSLPGGIYFYRLTSNGYSETKKMILVK